MEAHKVAASSCAVICRVGVLWLEALFTIAAQMVYIQSPALDVRREAKMKRRYLLFAMGFFPLAPVRAQDSVTAPPDTLGVVVVPRIPESLAETPGRNA